MAAEELQRAIRRVKGPPRKRVDTTPESPFEALLEQRMKALERQVEELKGRVNGLLLAVAGAVAVQVILGLLR